MKRSFVLGQEWLYYKIYCGVRISDQVLLDIISPLTLRLLDEGLIKKWFYIRFRDPHYHIRFRLLLANVDSLNTIIDHFNTMSKTFLDQELIWKIQTDTYKRELERYGINTMELSETIFFHDSVLINNAMDLVKDEELHFLFALKCVDEFINIFEFSHDNKMSFLRDNANSFMQEHDLNKITKVSIDKKYRGMRQKLDSFLVPDDMPCGYEKLNSLLSIRNNHIELCKIRILELARNKKLMVPIQDLLSSYIHMFVNRAFRDRQRYFEMITYIFLAKYNTSLAVRPVKF